MEAKVYNREGKEAGKVTVPESIFGLPWNADLVHQVVVSMQSNARLPIAHARTRGEVRGGGKKPWRQKGTGRARHGSSRSPIWVGGGVTHGPRNDKNYERKVNKKMRVKALFTLLSKKYKDNEVVFVDEVSIKEPKTKDAKAIITSLGGVSNLEKLATKRKNALYVAIPSKDAATEKSFRNIGSVEVDEVKNLNPLALLEYKYLVIANPSESLKTLEARGEK